MLPWRRKSSVKADRAAPRRKPGFLADIRGVTAIEFGFVGGPALLTLVGALEIGMTFYMEASLDYAAKKTARLLMTGSAQTSGLTASQVQAKVCSYLPSVFTCSNVFVNISALTAPAYITTQLASPYQTAYYTYVNSSQSGLITPPLNSTKDTYTTTSGAGACQLIVVQIVYPAPSLLTWLMPSSSYNLQWPAGQCDVLLLHIPDRALSRQLHLADGRVLK